MLPAGNVLSLVVNLRDISERMRAEEDRILLRQELAHLDRVMVLGELAASLAHEINQPLTAILSNAQAAQRFLTRGKPDYNEMREILADIISDDKRAGEVIRRLRSLYKKKPLDLTPLDINRVVKEAVSLVKREIIYRGISLDLELASTPTVLGDRVHLHQVVLNMILNAAEAMRNIDIGSRRLIIATARVNEKEVRVSIRDRGPGVDEENLNRIFKPFFTTKQGGMGMGLSISRSIIETHGGRFWAENNPDEGATFHFTVLRYNDPG